MKKTISAEINLHYELHVPENAKNRPLLIAVHGYAAHAPYMLREAKRIAPEDFVIASIQGPNKFYRETGNGDYKLAFGWLTDFEPRESIATHHYFINSLIEELSSEGVIDENDVSLFGFSQACALNFRYAFSHPEKLSRVLALCGGIPSDLDENPTYSPTKAKTIYLYGNDDEFYPRAKFRKFDERLSEYLETYASHEFQASHQITEEMRVTCKEFLAERES